MKLEKWDNQNRVEGTHKMNIIQFKEINKGNKKIVIFFKKCIINLCILNLFILIL